MHYLFLIISVFTSASASICGKAFNRRSEGFRDSEQFYNFLYLGSVFLAWGVVYATDFSFDPSVLIYSLAFGACYTLCKIGTIGALKYGPATLTSLFTALALLLTTVWGLFFWNAAVTPLVIIGLILAAVAIWLSLYSGKRMEKRISFKWLFYVLLSMFSNAGCTIVQRNQQTAFDGKHGSMLMFFATGISVIACTALYLKSNKVDTPRMLKKVSYISVIGGISNLVLNMMVLKMATTELSPSLIYPVIGVGGLTVVTLTSIFFFKEKLRPWQWIGILTGAVAITVLSI